MTTRGRFWQSVTLIALAHAALLIALLRWAGETKAASAPEITWIGGADADPHAEGAQPEIKTDQPENSAVSPPPSGIHESAPELAGRLLQTKSEIVLPDPTPGPTSSPSVAPKKKRTRSTPEPRPKKKAAATSTASPGEKKATAKPKEIAKQTSAQRKIANHTNGESKNDGSGVKSTGSSGQGTSGTGSGKSDAATATYYGNMLHDRFYRAWNQPQTVVASGAKLSAIARIRIEKDGRVSNFKIVKSSGNVLVDESLQSAGKKVTQVDALPAGIGSGGHYDVNINFALNSE